MLWRGWRGGSRCYGEGGEGGEELGELAEYDEITHPARLFGVCAGVQRELRGGFS